MSSTRDLVLEAIQKKQPISIIDLAAEVGINPISVRHHIAKLETARLVTSKDEKHGVGRPRRVYFLSDQGRELFPARTVSFATSLIQQLKESLPDGGLDEIFKGMGAQIYERDSADLGNMTLEQRLNWIDEQLSAEGFEVSIETTAKEIRIHESGCPYFYVGQKHHEVCTIDKELINNALESKSERTSCLLHGDPKCTYVIAMDSIPDNVLAPVFEGENK